MADNQHNGTAAATAAPPREQGRGIIKAVPSGDTVIVLQTDVRNPSGPPPEHEITLSGVRAPRLGLTSFDTRRDGTEDKPFAWPAREFLRKLAIGRPCQFTIEHRVPDGRRCYGEVTVLSAGADGVQQPLDLAQSVASEGWCEVSLPNNNREPRPAVQKLLELQEEARRAEKGMYTSNADAKAVAVRVVRKNADTLKVYERLNEQTVPAIVHEVRGGGQLRLILTDTLENVTVAFSGVQCPGYKRGADGDYHPEPFAREAKFFLEQAILHRDVLLTVHGVDRQLLFGTVVYANRDVGLELLKQGLAHYVEWSGDRTPLAEQYKAAEAAARAQRLRVFRNDIDVAVPHNSAAAAAAAIVAAASSPSATKLSIASAAQPALPSSFSGRVTEVVNAGAVRVAVDGVGAEPVLVNLASIRVPHGDRYVNVDDSDESNSAARRDKIARAKAERAYAHEAREYVRKRLLGKPVSVRLDYTNTAQPKNADRVLPPKHFYTLTFGADAKNLSVALAEQGLATVIDHGAQSPNRATDYEALLLAEERAKKAKRGLHAPPDKAPKLHINDLTRSGQQRGGRRQQAGGGDGAAKSVADKEKEEAAERKSAASLRSMVSILTRAGRQKAVVEWVVNAARLKVFVPKESCLIMFQLAGLRTPRSDSADTLEQQVSAAAQRWARDKLFQRDVALEIASYQERAGTFSGNLFFGNGLRQNAAVALVEQGFARVHEGGAQRTDFYEELMAAERSAKAAKRGWFINYDEAAEAARLAAEQEERDSARAQRNGDADADAGPAPRREEVELLVTEVVDGATFYAQLVGDAAARLETLMADIRAAPLDAPLEKAPRAGNKLYLAQFSLDSSWYRARVEEADADADSFLVRFVDYGNAERVPLASIRTLPAQFQQAAPYALLARLAYIRVPEADADYAEESADYLRELIYNKKVLANVEARTTVKERGAEKLTLHVSVGDAQSQVHVNAAMLRAGLAAVQRSRDRVNRGGPRALIAKLEEEQAAAKKERLALWRYGDAFEDDEVDGRAERRG